MPKSQSMREKRKRRDEGFHSAAGLIRYFESEEESALKIDPRFVIGACIAMAIIVQVIAWQWPL